MPQLGKLFILSGLVLVLVGAVLMLGPRKLPGDIVYRGRNTTVYFPIVTCLVISVVLTLVSWLISFFRR
jgi:hypothetical protein